MAHEKAESRYVAEKHAECPSLRGVGGERTKFRLPEDVATAGGAAADPHPKFLYHGGPVVLDPRVFAMFVGDWTSPANQARWNRLIQDFEHPIVTAYMTILSQDGCRTDDTGIGSA